MEYKMTLWQTYLKKELAFISALKKVTIPLMVWAFGIIYIWFGALKIFDMSPVEASVVEATDWIFPPIFVEILGVWEVLIGLFILIRPLRRLGLLLLFLQFPGTFLPFITNPELCFTHAPFALTLKGQYIIKNLLAITGGLVLITSLQKTERKNQTSS